MTLFVIVKHNPPTAEDFEGADPATGSGLRGWEEKERAIKEGRRLMAQDGIRRWVAEMDLPEHMVRHIEDRP